MEPNTVSYKAIFIPGDNSSTEIRRFVVSRDVSTSYEYLKEKLSTLFPRLRHEIYAISWTDEDGDKVQIGSDEELMIALTEMSGPTYKLSVTIKESAGASIKDDIPSNTSGDVHAGVTCDGCDSSVQGFRYKCMVCLDYDLCGNCEAKGFHPGHNMIRIASPEITWPKHFFHRVNKMHERMNNRRCGSARDSPRDSSATKPTACPFTTTTTTTTTSNNEEPRNGGAWARKKRGQTNRPASVPINPTEILNNVIKGFNGMDMNGMFGNISPLSPTNPSKTTNVKINVNTTPEPEQAEAAKENPPASNTTSFTTSSTSTKTTSMEDGQVKETVVTSSSTPRQTATPPSEDDEWDVLNPHDAAHEAASEAAKVAHEALAAAASAASAAAHVAAQFAVNNNNNIEVPINVEKKDEEEKKETEVKELEIIEGASAPPAAAATADENNGTINVPISVSEQPAKVLFGSENGVLYPELPEETEEPRREVPPRPVTPKPEDVIVTHPDPRIQVALQAMVNMGFTNDGGWLTNLLEAKNGDIGKALDVLQPHNPKK